jgi:hypothetical protein
MDKPNTDKTIPDADISLVGINLENPSFSKGSFRDSGKDQQLFNKDSFSSDQLGNQLHRQMKRIMLMLTT